MESLKKIKRRIKAAGNISQITKAMEMVAASKMRKAQLLALQGRAYAQKIREVTANLSKGTKRELHPLLMEPKLNNGEIRRKAVVLITTNKGLCGGLNTNLIRFLDLWMKEESNLDFQFITLGGKGRSFILARNKKLIADFSKDFPWRNEIPAIIELVKRGFLTGEWHEVWLCYSDFISALSHLPIKIKILPVEKMEEESQRIDIKKCIIEPSITELLSFLLPHYLEVQLRKAVLDAEASEHSARMLAMKNATENAQNLILALQLDYNKARQQQITFEIADIVTAKISVEEKRRNK